MGKTYEGIDDRLRHFIEAQHVFFVATAPLAADGRVNLSPKGLDSLRVIDRTTVAYLDYVGSGVETIAHVRENGRIVVMLCAFEGAPNIVRLHGRGEVLEPQDAAFADALALFGAPKAAVRAIVRVRLERITDSCGYGVPIYRYEGERTQLPAWAERKGDDGARRYQEAHNATSIDGLPGLRWTGPKRSSS